MSLQLCYISLQDIALSCYVPGLLVTASTDDTIKFWDIQVEEQAYKEFVCVTAFSLHLLRTINLSFY